MRGHSPTTMHPSHQAPSLQQQYIANRGSMMKSLHLHPTLARRLLTIGLLVAGAAMAPAHAQAPGGLLPTQLPGGGPAPDAASVAAGEQLYEANCATCHRDPAQDPRMPRDEALRTLSPH